MRDLIHRMRESEIWPWLLWFLSFFPITLETAFSMVSPDPVMKTIGGCLFLFGLCGVTWGLMATLETREGPTIITRAEKELPNTYIEWGFVTIVRWGQTLTVLTLIVYSLMPIWQVAVLVSLLMLLVAVLRFPAVCRFFIPRYYTWSGGDRLRESNACAIQQ